MSKEYYILSLDGGPDLMLFWRPNNAGYTTDLNEAGRFTEEQIRNPIYFSDRPGTVAVPCEVVDDVAVRVVRNDQGHLARWLRRGKLKPVGAGTGEAVQP